jgi:hypothetical protein
MTEVCRDKFQNDICLGSPFHIYLHTEENSIFSIKNSEYIATTYACGKMFSDTWL